LFVFTLSHFMHSSGTKILLFYGILMVVFVQATILMKLWYWIANQKITVLKAIKQLELCGASSSADALRPEDLRGPVEGLARRERTVWWVSLLAGCALIAAVKGAEVSGAVDPGAFDRGGMLSSSGCITLAADGSGSAVTEMSFIHEGALARRGFNFHAPQTEKTRFVDGSGAELAFTTSPQNEHVRYDVRLPRPVMPGERFNYSRFSEIADAATVEDGIWTYSSDVAYGYNTNEISQTIVLPAGAEIISASPWPESTFTLQGRPSVRFTGVRARDEALKYTIKYRLAEKVSE
jgi:hypothetical protein